MTLSTGTRLGPYEILSEIGAGGMGEVYRARDARLGRDVAIKILPDLFASDPERLARFEREAQLLASLNHPNIAAIYGLEESGSGRALVLELVEGLTLADRIARGALPFDETLAVARQIAEALEAAHERGVIHRDLKPANIKLTPSGSVKVLDFGLARLAATAEAGLYAGAPPALTNSPTMMGASMPGSILGTAAYMSPEQAKGREAGRTADLWAFGCVLYEMLTGRSTFGGESVPEILGEVLKTDPDWRQLPAETPSAVRRLLHRCLQKDPKHRLQHAGDARIELAEVTAGPEVVDAAPRTTVRRERLAWATALALVASAAAAIVAGRSRPAAGPADEMRFEISTPPTQDASSMAISPDGRQLVFVADTDAGPRLWVRPLSSVSARTLAGTEGAAWPFWSPDNRSVGFFADGKIKRIDLDNGAIQALGAIPAGRGGSWNRDGTIIYASLGGPIFRTSAGESDRREATRLGAQHASHQFPSFLPDGRHFLFWVNGTPNVRGLYVGQLDSSETARLFDSESPAVYSSGYLFFSRQEALFAQPFDERSLTPIGSAVRVIERASNVQAGALSASATGSIAFRSGTDVARSVRQFVWMDRSGREGGRIGEPDRLRVAPMSVSSDGRRVAMFRAGGNVDIWLLETGRGIPTRFTFDTADDVYPVWSRDGSLIAFGSNRTGMQDLYVKASTGVGDERPLRTGTQSTPVDWSPDGRLLLYRTFDTKTGYDLMAVAPDGKGTPIPIARTAFEERDGQFSPDGKWIAYESNESGRYEIYIQPFPGPGGKTQLSNAGGAQVRWRSDGKELFYVAFDGRLMAVPTRLAPDGKSMESDAPVPLFATHIGGSLQPIVGAFYVPAPDGQRFLMNAVVDEPPSPIIVILNWRADERK